MTDYTQLLDRIHELREWIANAVFIGCVADIAAMEEEILDIEEELG
jgi:hypothetical protein